MDLTPHVLTGVDGFQWDAGNSTRNWHRHRVMQGEAEQVFLNQPLLLAMDTGHSGDEPRYFALGRTDVGRLMSIAFTIRGTKVRVISARPMSRREGTPMSKPKSRKAIPRFRDEAAERHFWESHDTSDYVDWTRALKVKLPDLKPSTTTISLRLPADVLEELKQLANRKDVPYQSLLKILLAESLARERRPARRTRSALPLERVRATRKKAGLTARKSAPRRRR